MMRFRAQSSVELILILAISVIILSVLINLATTQLSQIKQDYSVRSARQSLNSLIAAIDETFAQGPGSVRFITIRWPEGVDASNTRIVGNSIFLRVYQNDIIATASPFITGSLNVYPGEQRIKITSHDSNVSLGILSFTSNVSSIYLPLTQDTNGRAQVVLTNLHGSAATITSSMSWSPAFVSTMVSPSTGTLGVNGTMTLDVNVSASATAYGNYVGFLNIVANFDDSSVESLNIPLNVEVFPASSGYLSTFPVSLKLFSLRGDTNSGILQVCNTGTSSIGGISFTPSSGDAGGWITAPSSISSLMGGSCTDKNVVVTIPGDANYEVKTGSILLADSTGANVSILPLSVKVEGQGDLFSWDWNTVSTTSTTLNGFGLRNLDEHSIQITSFVLKHWWDCDSNVTRLKSVVANGTTVFTGSVGDGNTVNVTDFNIPGTTAYLNNILTFDPSINDENEQFNAHVTFSDGSTYTSPIYGTGCAIDTSSPAQVTNLTAYPGSEPGTIRLTFTFSGDNNFSGTPSNLDIRMFKQPDANTPSVYETGTSLMYSGGMLQGGSTGSLNVTDLNAGETYFFTAVFFDDKDNNGGISNIASGRPWNKFSYLGADFNITNFAHSLSSDPPLGTAWDVNLFTLSDFNFGGSRDRNIMLRVTPDNNSNNSWILYVGIQSTTINSIKIWYPYSAIDGTPGGTPNYSGNPNQSTSSPINLLSPSLINSGYRYDGNLVSLPRPNHLYINWLRNINDFNLVFDMNQAQYT